MKHLLTTLLTGVAMATMASSAQAAAIETAIGLALDGSASISTSDFTLQKNAYANVLGDSSLLPADGSVVVYVNQFSSSASTESPALRISSEADRTTLVDNINAIGQFNGGTDIGDGINDAASSLDAFFGGGAGSNLAPDFRAVIDVSTDGQSFSGPTAATNAINGIGLSNITFDQVNCLGVGGSADCSFIPAGSFSKTADDFSAFQNSLEEKIGRELNTGPGTTPVPEPSSVALLTLGLIGIAVMYRRRLLG